jgi:hypothetical protein
MAQPKVADPVVADESPEPCRPQQRVPGELQADSAQRIAEFVGELVRRIRRAYVARGVRPAAKAAALTRDPLEAMLATCTDGLTGLRDRALLPAINPINGDPHRARRVYSRMSASKE